MGVFINSYKCIGEISNKNLLNKPLVGNSYIIQIYTHSLPHSYYLLQEDGGNIEISQDDIVSCFKQETDEEIIITYT